jgi:hypothetical protein
MPRLVGARIARRLAMGAGGVLAIAWVSVCIQVGSAWPWSLVVHEDGRRTLLQTVLYVEHALGELPLDLVLAVALAGAALHFFPESSPGRKRRAGYYLLAFVLCAAGIVGGAFVTAGKVAAIENLLQVHTRNGAPPVVGAHWRYHLLSRLALMMLAFALTGLLAGSGAPRRQASDRRVPLFGAALSAFGLLTAGFGMTTEPFVDPVYIGHQARELFTHTLITVPIGLAACLACVAWKNTTDRRPFAAGGGLRVVAAGGLSVALGGYLALGVVVTDAVAEGQTAGVSALLFPHFFEHTLTYLLVGTAAPSLYLLLSRSREGAMQA